MKKVTKKIGLLYFIMAETMSLHFLGFEALASESSGGWRPIYDEVLLWFNAQEIERIEEKKKQAADKVTEINKMVDESKTRFAKIKDRIVEQGERKKAEIIESAQNQSKMMLENAKQRIDFQFVQAKFILRKELIDTALNLAMERIPKEMTPEDNEKFTREFLTSTATE
ncbi:MAG: ATP synthase F0 subunit B [Deltaproteobacteria bacterium]|nr:ATP synthase F0 subunit B [Deltaproteobacteria bacterium]